MVDCLKICLGWDGWIDGTIWLSTSTTKWMKTLGWGKEMNEVDTFQSKPLNCLKWANKFPCQLATSWSNQRATQKFGGSKIEQQTTLVIANMDRFSKQMISFARK
jgi:hypothetical protein